MFLCFLIILIIIFIFFYVVNNQKKTNCYNPRETFVSMTTIPERLNHPWFYENLKYTITTLPKNSKLILNVPDFSLKNIPYEVPESVKDLQSSTFTINYCGKDEGPITKIRPILQNKSIPEDSIIIIIDDDIFYRKKVLYLLQKSVEKHPAKVSCMCNSRIEGFAGYGFIKKVMLGLKDITIPESCIRIDDFIISKYVDSLKIGKVPVSYRKNSHGFCSINQKITDTHPEWEELCVDNENRNEMNEICWHDLKNQKIL